MLIVILAIIAACSLAFCQWLVFFYAPLEAEMGVVQKIFYFHLPLAWWALVAFFAVFVGSCLYLWRKNPEVDHFCQAACETGVLFCSLTLITGMIWGKQSWGVWWTWDPRLSTALVAWFLYCAYLVIGHLDSDLSKKSRVRAVFGIVAFLDVPLVFFSARIFRSIHPAVFASREGYLPPEMAYCALACALAFGFLWLALTLARKRQLDLSDGIRKIALNMARKEAK